MALPQTLDPATIDLAAQLMRGAVADPRFDHLSAEDRRAIVARGVEKIMAAGAFARDGTIFMPPAALPVAR